MIYMEGIIFTVTFWSNNIMLGVSFFLYDIALLDQNTTRQRTCFKQVALNNMTCQTYIKIILVEEYGHIKIINTKTLLDL